MARIIPRRRPAASSADRSSQWLAAIIDSSDDAIVSKDLQGVIHSWNEGARRLFGYDAAEIIGQSVTILIPADRQDEETEILGRIRRGEKVDHHETIRRRKDGTLVEVSLTVSPIKDASGRIIGASKIARDLTDRKAVERIMRQGNERFRLLANHAPVGIFLSNRAGECVFVNECWCALSGLTFAQALDAGWTQALHPADRERVLADWRQAVAAGRASAAEFRFLRPDGTIVWLQGNAVPFQDGDRFQGYLGSCQDVTRRKQAELQAAFLQGLTDRLAGVTGSTRIKEITQHALGEHLSADRCCFVEINAGGDTATLDRDWHRPDLASLAGRYRLAEPGRPGWHDQLALPRQQIADVNALAAPLEVRAALAGHQIRSVASTAFRQDGRWAFTLAATSRRPRRWN